MDFNGKDLTIARAIAGHYQNDAANEIGTSENTVVNFEKREELPKSPLIQKAIESYITKYIETYFTEYKEKTTK